MNSRMHHSCLWRQASTLRFIICPLVAMLFDVHMKVAGLSKTFSTVLAYVRLLAGMCVDVNFELESQCK